MEAKEVRKVLQVEGKVMLVVGQQVTHPVELPKVILEAIAVMPPPVVETKANILMRATGLAGKIPSFIIQILLLKPQGGTGLQVPHTFYKRK